MTRRHVFTCIRLTIRCGAEFTVRLPLQPEPAAVRQIPAAPQPARQRLRILVVEDNRDSAESLRMLLDLFGYEVIMTHSGPEGVQAAEHWKPDVVLCDIGLPSLDGYGVVSKLRRNPATARARIIAVTGYGADTHRTLTAPLLSRIHSQRWRSFTMTYLPATWAAVPTP